MPSSVAPVSIHDDQRLLECLENLPHKLPFKTLLHCPGSLAVRFGGVFSKQFWQFAWAVEHSTDFKQQRIAALLLRWTPALILRDVVLKSGADEDSSTENASTAASVKRRLQLAERNQWLTLALELESAIKSFKEQHVARPTVDDDALQPPKLSSDTKLYTNACRKIAGNCIRSAVQMLM